MPPDQTNQSNSQPVATTVSHAFDEALEPFHFKMLADAKIDLTHTDNGEVLCLNLQESKDVNLVNAFIADTRRKKSATLGSYSNTLEGEATKFTFYNNCVMLSVEHQTYLANFLTYYRLDKAFLAIYKVLKDNYLEYSYLERAKSFFTDSFYLEFLGTTPFEKVAGIRKHVDEKPKSIGVIAYGLAENYFKLDYKNDANLRNEIEEHLNTQFPKRRKDQDDKTGSLNVKSGVTK